MPPTWRGIWQAAEALPRTTLEEARQLLIEAKAPEPWARPEFCEQLSWALHMAKTQVVWGDEAPPNSARAGTRARAQAAINELRCALPDLIGQQNALGSIDSLRYAPNDEAAEVTRVLEAESLKYQSLLNSLEDIPQFSSKILGSNWHEYCISFWLYYRLIVGSGAPTRNGPANRFVKLALKKIGHAASIKPSAIEATLTKWLNAVGDDQFRHMEESWPRIVDPIA